MQKRISGLANKLAKKPIKAITSSGAKSRSSYGTFSKSIKEFVPVLDSDSEVVPEIEKPEIFAVIVEMEKFGKDGKEGESSDDEDVDDIEAVQTPKSKFSFKQIFHHNSWWFKGNADKWYPYDTFFFRLHGLSNKRERIFGLWVNLVSSGKKCLENRWNDGDASIESQLPFESRPGIKSPADEHWELPLWLRAQPFRLILCNNPFDEGMNKELFDSELDKLFDCKEISLFYHKPRFLFVKTLKPFVPKVKYPKPGQYKRIYFDHNKLIC